MLGKEYRKKKETSGGSNLLPAEVGKKGLNGRVYAVCLF
jgi:hypothetical protein